MHLVLDLCQHLEKFALYVHGYCLRWEAEEQFVGAVAVVFCQSGNRNRQVQLAFGDFPHHVHLPFTTIGDGFSSTMRLYLRLTTSCMDA